MTTTCQINQPHCENCGATDYESLHTGDQGYTACCNELISQGPSDCRDHHGEHARYQAGIDAHALRLFGTTDRTALGRDRMEQVFAAVDADRSL